MLIPFFPNCTSPTASGGTKLRNKRGDRDGGHGEAVTTQHCVRRVRGDQRDTGLCSALETLEDSGAIAPARKAPPLPGLLRARVLF